MVELKIHNSYILRHFLMLLAVILIFSMGLFENQDCFFIQIGLFARMCMGICILLLIVYFIGLYIYCKYEKKVLFRLQFLKGIYLAELIFLHLLLIALYILLNEKLSSTSMRFFSANNTIAILTYTLIVAFVFYKENSGFKFLKLYIYVITGVGISLVYMGMQAVANICAIGEKAYNLTLIVLFLLFIILTTSFLYKVNNKNVYACKPINILKLISDYLIEAIAGFTVFYYVCALMTDYVLWNSITLFISNYENIWIYAVLITLVIYIMYLIINGYLNSQLYKTKFILCIFLFIFNLLAVSNYENIHMLGLSLRVTASKDYITKVIPFRYVKGIKPLPFISLNRHLDDIRSKEKDGIIFIDYAGYDERVWGKFMGIAYDEGNNIHAYSALKKLAFYDCGISIHTRILKKLPFYDNWYFWQVGKW